MIERLHGCMSVGETTSEVTFSPGDVEIIVDYVSIM